MSRMFCTVKEAAATLHASEDQINALLDRGILPEFRQGPHRLLRQADIGVLDVLRGHGPQAQGPAQPPILTEPPRPRRRRSKAGRATRRRVQRSAPAVARSPRPPSTRKARPGTGKQDPGTGPRREAGRSALSPYHLPPFSPSSAVAVAGATELVARPGGSRRAEVRPPSCPPPAQTLGQWFWMGLVQDRPSAIALLSGLVLLALSALAAGICLTAGGF